MLVGFAEGLGAAKTYATRAHYEVDANRELLGLGAANVGSGLASGMVVNGSLSKTAVNGSAGARSQVSGLVVAVLTVITLLFLTGLFESLPEATLAAVVIAAVIELVDIAALREFYRLYSRQLGRIYGAGGAGRLHRRRGRAVRRADLRHAARPRDRHRRLVAVAAVPRVQAPRRRARPGRRDAGAVRRRRSPSGERGPARRRRAARRSRPVLRQRRRRARRDPIARDDAGHARCGPRRRGDRLHRRHRPADARGGRRGPGAHRPELRARPRSRTGRRSVGDGGVRRAGGLPDHRRGHHRRPRVRRATDDGS